MALDDAFSRRFPYRLIFLFLLIAWTATMGGLAWWYKADSTANQAAMARMYARACHDKDLIYRRWNSIHGGVYIPVSEEVQPNPYLHAPEREVVTPSGRTLTLVNPAYMTRQVHELAAAPGGVNAHITSLKPLNPHNDPDAWEREALLGFEKGEKEASTVIEQDGQQTARLMRPLYVEQSCLKCHEQQGYEIGDVRGGISVSLSVDPVWKAEARHIRKVFVALGGIWLVGVVAIVLTGRSISQRQLERERAMETMAHFSAIVNSSDDAIIGVSLDGTIASWNPGAERLYGYTASEILGQPLSKTVPPDRPDELSTYLELALHGGRVEHYDTVRRRKDGSLVDVSVTVSSVQNHSGDVIGASIIAHEITGRKRAEQDLIDAKIAAEAASRTKSEFLANMSHEIRTPMTAILGFTDILADEPTREEGAEACRVIKRNGEHLLNLINDILDLSKIEAGKLAVDLRACSPRQIVSDVLSTMQVRADAKGLELSAECRGDVPARVRTDPGRLRQILVNLVGNAIKFTEVGSVRLVVEECDSSLDHCGLRFDVIDTGIGIAEDHLDKLFRAFSQVDGSTGRCFGGSGLGLAISKRLAEMLGGDISVTSVYGQGTTFSVTIAVDVLEEHDAEPAVDDHEASVPVKGSLPELNCRVLLAEDGPDNQRLVAFLLRKAGAEVTIVDNGKKAVEAFAHQGNGDPAFDVVLMDIQMPVMDGFEATRTLRSMGYEGPILALTANAMKEDRQACLDAGCDDYLAKPINQAVLLRLVAKHAEELRSSRI